ncbi:hypothetical protein Nepgr_020916 [Nepenthes gracilis]|uniref:Uncharacterized protein n=1 Tax=Nepenthes gracilis TaxID=150966 RepID=A0AAD3SXQ6_NEPGR|nr:hypothetical protein Nepgr_020916 [Nepenthes gracilis]
MQLRPRNGRRLVLFPLPFPGHLNPMLHLANILHFSGFSISIIHTHFNSPNPADHPHFSFHPIPDGLPPKCGASMEDIIPLLNALNQNCSGPFTSCLSEMLSDASSQPVACLITDALWHVTQAAADGLEIPRIVLRTSSFTTSAVLAALPLLRQKGYLPLRESQLEELVHEFPPLKIKDIPRSGTTDHDPMYQFISTMCKESKASRGIIINSFEELEPSAMSTVQREFGVPVFPIGPFHKFLPPSPSSLLNPDRTCISWLDAQPPKSVLYVSFGSVASIDEDEFSETAWGLVNSNQPFLWVVRPGLVRGSARAFQVPDGILDTAAGRARIVEWAPQLEVLSHAATGGFWTHSGWNSTLESLSAGVPMLCRPVLFDQNINARYVTDVWKVGISIESKLEGAKIEEAIKRLMIGREAMEMRERAACLRGKADRCLREGGSSYKYLEKLVSLIMSF